MCLQPQLPGFGVGRSRESGRETEQTGRIMAHSIWGCCERRTEREKEARRNPPSPPGRRPKGRRAIPAAIDLVVCAFKR